ncbi:16S rRNA methyltransferase rsmB/F domain-containing protein [Sarocladium implicatum]|nr:16S rRNA methyltransferase rsmB/F domain-containing protein [Sarocladium implicatum]
MGKKNFRGGRGGGRGGSRNNGGGGGGGYRDYRDITKENTNLQKFYDHLLQLPEEEKAQYWDALKRELPNSFRFCGSKGHALAVKRLLQVRYIPDITKIEHFDGRPVEPPKPVGWYPDDLAWWMTTPKTVIRKFPPFAAFQKFLVSETSVGNISRQEVVSMIPPLLIDLKPGMTVLDMCAAPGSKAAQLLEMVHQGEEARVRKVLRAHAKEDGLDLGQETKEEQEVDLEADASDDGRATGLLIANDSDYKRCHMLVHQLKRLSSPNLIVSNHDATQFPSIRLPQKNKNESPYLKFDRVLADVPCSGDGTFRKNINLWKDWNPGSALGLHTTQVRILVRALQLLKVGGRVVYSTCSMNPVENEAIVVSAIERCGGPDNVEIVDCADRLPGLKRYPGMKQWTIMDKSARMWSNWDDVEKFAEEENNGVIPGKVVRGMFPRKEGTDLANLPLERCMRVYPHMQDTGGFFITVLEKKSDFKAKNEKEAAAVATSDKPAASAETEKTDPANGTESETAKSEPEANIEDAKSEADVGMKTAPAEESATNGTKRPLDEAETQEQPPKKAKVEDDGTAKAEDTTAAAPKVETIAPKPRRNGPVEEPFKFLDPSHPVIQNIKEFYHLSPRFPDNRYLVRNEMGEPAKAIYYVTSLMRDILTENEGRGIKFIHGGVRMYMKQDAPSADVCRWRIQSEGMPILQGYVGESRIVRLTNKETLRRLLIEMFPRVQGEHWKQFDEIGERVRDIGMGCCVLRVEPEGDDPDFSERMALPLWKSVHSLNLMLPKEDRSAMLLRIFNDTTPLVNAALKKDQPATEAKKEDAEKVEDAAAQGETAQEEVGDVDVEDLPTPES